MRINNYNNTNNQEKLNLSNKETNLVNNCNKNLKRKKYEYCPLCRSKDFYEFNSFDHTRDELDKIGIEKSIKWMNCKKCSHQFTEGYFTDEALALIFSGTPSNQQVGFEIEKGRVFSAKMIDKVLPYQQNGYWLDFGFGNGSLLFTAQEFGFDPVGIDLRISNVKIMKQLGFEVYCEHINKLKFLKDFSVISVMDVLEHVPYPKEILKELSSLLKKGGCMLISMPNSESMVWRLLDASNNNPYMTEIEHYHNFSRSNLYNLLKECDLKPIKYGISDRYKACMEVLAIKN